MKTKHTPGPWVITRTDKEDDFPEVMVGTPDTREARRDYSLNWAGRNVAQVFNQFGEEYDANARLIASAPDLYNALCDLLEWAKGNRGRKDNNPYCVPEVRKALEAVGKVQDLWPDQLFEAETGEAR